jgi:flagellar motor switch protein FliM
MAEAEKNEELDMAAAMGAAAADSGSADEMDMALAMGDTGALSQSEIDNLLGFDVEVAAPTSGIKALLDRSNDNYERLPMLEVVFDRFVRTLSTSLRNFTSENVEINIQAITSMRFEDYLNSVPLPALLAIFQAVEWENLGVITIDSSLTYSMVDILLGGGRTHRPVRIEGRPFTTIEQDIVKSVTRLMLEDLGTAFNPLTPATFRFERLETNPRFATITRPANAVIVVSLRVEMDERGGKAEIMLPYATIEPIKELLVQMFSGESFGSDMSWEEILSKELGNTKLRIQAQLKPKRITLEELGRLKVGSTIVLNDAPGQDIEIFCHNQSLMSGSVGVYNKHLAIKINNVDLNKMENL